MWWRRKKSLGDRGEDLAARYLRRKGYKVLCRGLRNRLGEIDLVCRDRQTIVFVEVKTRSSDAAGQPFEAVDRDKQRRLTRAALAFLKQKGWLRRRARFDVVSILLGDETDKPEIRHFVNAFEAVGSGQMFC